MENLEDLFNYLSDMYDKDNIQIDYDNNNFDLNNWDTEIDRYYMPNIVIESLENGQINQAKDQCSRYGLFAKDFSELVTVDQLKLLF